MKAPVAHDGYGRVAVRLLRWVFLLVVAPLALCFLGSTMGLVPERDWKPARAAEDVAKLHTALGYYRAKTGTWPPEASWAQVLVEHQILERPPFDPWDQPYRYRLVSTDGGAPEPVVTSLGKDLTPDTADDLPRKTSFTDAP